MPISLDSDQAKQVALKRLKPNLRPKYFNATIGQMSVISEEFEAFLILQGRPKNKETVDWLQKASSYSIQDADRDSLVNEALTYESDDAKAAEKELAPIVEQFNMFRQRFNMTGFESVVESGQLLADLQRPMNEIITLGSKYTHRRKCASLLKERLINNGLTSDQSKQLNSWFNSLTTY